MVRRAAVFAAASSVRVAPSARVGVHSIPRVVSGGWWVCAGVICTAFDSCFGGACWGVRPRELCGVRWGWGGGGASVVVCPSWVLVVAPAVVPSSSVPRSPLQPLPWGVSCPHVVSLPVPYPYGRLPLTWGASVPPCLSVPCCPLPSPCPCPSRFPVWWWSGGGGGR